MANNLTLDSTEPQESEFTPEEQENIAAGEQLIEQQQELLAGKYKNAEELEKAYIELQGKLGSNEEPQEEGRKEEEVEEEQPEVSPAVQTLTDATQEYYANEGKLSEETMAKFTEMSSKDLVEAYLKMQAENPQQQQQQASPDLSDGEVNTIHNSVGGEAQYNRMVQWASENLDAKAIKAFDNVVESGQIDAIKLAVAGLKSEYENANGYEGTMIQGKAPNSSVETLRSQAEVVRAMQDPRYDTDPAYRQDVFEKLERSSIDY